MDTRRGSIRRTVQCVVVLGAATALGGCATIKVYKGYQNDKEGVVYRLPRAVLLVNVPVVRTVHRGTLLALHATRTDGAFAGLPIIALPKDLKDSIELNRKHIEELRGELTDKENTYNELKEAGKREFDPKLKKAKAEKEELEASVASALLAPSVQSFKFGTVVVTEAVEPDPDAVFFVELAGSHSQDRSLTLSFNKMGALIDGKSNVRDRKLELALATIQSAAGIASSAVPLFPGARLLAVPADEARAQQLRSDLKKLIEYRNALVREGKAEHLDVDTLQEIFRQLDAAEEAIAPQFYTTTQEAVPLIFEVRPDFRNSGLDDLYQNGRLVVRLSRKEGARLLSEPTNGITPPPQVPDGFGAPEGASLEQAIRLQLKKNKSYDISGGTPVSDSGFTGFVYRIPGAADVAVDELKADQPGSNPTFSKLQKRHYAQTIQIPQAGITAALPPDAGLSPEYNVSFALYEETGALKTLDIESKSIDPALITAFGESISGSIDKAATAIQAARAARAAKPSQFARMTARVNEYSELLAALKAAGLPIPALPSPVDGSGTADTP